MAITHAKPAEVVDVRPLGRALKDTKTTTLIKTDALEVLRLVVPEGKGIGMRQVPGEVTVQCLEGLVALKTDKMHVLEIGELLYLEGGESHSVHGIEDASLLVTILLYPKEHTVS